MITGLGDFRSVEAITVAAVYVDMLFNVSDPKHTVFMCLCLLVISFSDSSSQQRQRCALW